MASYRNAAQIYGQNKIATATPAELTLMLYEGAIKFCNKAIEAVNKQEVEKAYESKEYAGLDEWFDMHNELAGPDGGKLIMQSITVKKTGERIEYFYVNGFYLK